MRGLGACRREAGPHSVVTVTAMDGRFMGGAQRGLHVVGTAILINRRFKIGDHWRFVGGARAADRGDGYRVGIGEFEIGD